MTTTNPDVSFVIAAFKAADTITRAIDSALAQEDVSVEVIVVDDASQDNTAAVVEAIADPRIRLIRLPANRGPGGARNAGLDAARGEWVAILDADDTVRPGRLARMIARARRESADIAVDNLEVLNLDGRRERMFDDTTLENTPVLTLAAFIESNVLFRSTYNFGYMKPIFERRFLEEIRLRFKEEIRIGEDYILLASALAEGGRCVVDPSSGYRYHIREGSISRVLELRHIDAMIAADTDFLGTHAIDASAMAMQRKRSRSLYEARAFLALVEHIKSRSLGGAIRTALSSPRALRHLRMPIAVRLRRLVAPLSRLKPATMTVAAERSTSGKSPHTRKG
ncbi:MULTISPECIES: glycosyltransferase family 2 protein [Ensifer]|uniref:glycosyltransferase family 2 protein n=1 Tax=Ensifer TaxID=106591 RepID=UPI00042EFF52|nr:MULTISPECIES: glycosyltransferase family 2 protein [Ensifer]AHK45826.1 succinoglycan biosynthesis protein ExoO [Ensifer adhaerens OV14]MDP9633590.1 succinoglycan biosynthesis protein ExoO [Ensifer adhaerens]MBD9491478.1 glycosyltransferase family 2 protein [Ensifer sp. ENS11]NOV19380.1 glycosyltransferase family 2 protein [Ensifer canadensis]OMQ43170.1 glycosyl transferase [Ensifer sp. 1H6]